MRPSCMGARSRIEHVIKVEQGLTLMHFINPFTSFAWWIARISTRKRLTVLIKWHRNPNKGNQERGRPTK